MTGYQLYGKLAQLVVEQGAIQATVYLSEKFIIRATRRRYGGKIRKRKTAPIELFFTAGRPNYREREFIKACKKAKEPFPVRKIQLKFAKVDP